MAKYQVNFQTGSMAVSDISSTSKAEMPKNYIYLDESGVVFSKPELDKEVITPEEEKNFYKKILTTKEEK